MKKVKWCVPVKAESNNREWWNNEYIDDYEASSECKMSSLI